MAARLYRGGGLINSFVHQGHQVVTTVPPRPVLSRRLTAPPPRPPGLQPGRPVEPPCDAMVSGGRPSPVLKLENLEVLFSRSFCLLPIRRHKGEGALSQSLPKDQGGGHMDGVSRS